jgi:hypothetical protein
MLARLFHRCNFLDKIAPMTYQCKCGRKRWGLFDEGKH